MSGIGVTTFVFATTPFPLGGEDEKLSESPETVAESVHTNMTDGQSSL
jgi:hypothetical protein